MNALTRSLATLLLGTTAGLFAAPSVQLPHEWAAPLDGGKAMVLVQTDTGQARILAFNNAFQASESGPIQTNLPGVTGMSTGLDNNSQEKVIMASTTANSVRLLNTGDLSLTTLQPETPGPVTAIPMRLNVADPSSIYALSQYGDTAHVLQRYTNLYSGTPATLGTGLSLYTVNDLQPSSIPGSPSRQAGLISIQLGGNISLYEVQATAAGVTYSLIANGGSGGEKIASQCLGSDGRLCALRYKTGQTKALIVTQPYGFPSGSVTSNTLPFPIGSITAVPSGITNAPHGVLITAADGSSAIYAHIINGQTFSTQATFTPQGVNRFTGIIPVSGRGFLTLEGTAVDRISARWRGYQNNGAGWVPVSTGSLAPWLPAQQNFATLFWFRGTPLVDPTAEIVKFETRADWTRKTSVAPIPAQIELSDLLTPGQGLTPSGLVAPTAPPGANFLVTSQYEDQVSITALDTDVALLSPSLNLSPPSGNYDNPVTVAALYDSGANELFFREDRPGSPWQSFDALTVGYPSSWLFYAKNRSTGVAGPIVRRSFAFPGVNPNSFDSDHDGVPDYVERRLGLDPTGGADSDGDFQSDLEEILAGTDPNDHNSNTPPEDPRTPPFLGEGFQLIAQAFNRSHQGASPANAFLASTTADDFPGETLRLFDLQGNLLAEENVKILTAPPALAGFHGAAISVATPLSEQSWITLSAPTTFSVLNVLNPARTGREIIKVAQRPVNPVAQVITTPSGTDLTADADAWINQARLVHPTHVTVSAITELNPVDNALSALAEQAVFNSLKTLSPAKQAELGVPATIGDFTLFPQRRGETSRTGLSKAMWDELLDAGCDFPAMLTVLQAASSNATVNSLANTLTGLHVTGSVSQPYMSLPLDVFRSIIQNGSIVDPAPGDPPRSNPYASIPAGTITTVKTLFDNLLAQIPGTKRPTATWFLVVQPSTTPLHDYNYLRQGTANLVFLQNKFGERQILEQGLGLALGTIFEITGYTDVTGPAGFDTMEFIRIESVVTPIATDTDTNGNLLDDGWENVFFGDLGVVGPYDPHPITGHSYLQYHVSGADPRAGSLTTPIVNLAPADISLVWIPAANAYDLNFDFPAEFISSFDFTVLSSTTLNGFAGPAEFTEFTIVSPGHYRFRIKIAESNLPKNFFQIGMSLKAE